MRCPDCQNNLKDFNLKGIEIQECPECKGKWFKRDQLRLAKDRQDEDLRWLNFDPFGKDAEKLSVPSKGKKCPRCLKLMSSLTYRESGIVIDKCFSCEGIWLRAGELVKIIRYLENVVTRQSARELARSTFKQFIEIFRGKEGRISEVKDFLAVLYLLELRVAVEHPQWVEASKNIYKYTPFK